MLLPATQILKSLTDEIRHLGGSQGQGSVASAEQSVSLALGLLTARETGGVATVRAQLQHLEATLTSRADELSVLNVHGGTLDAMRTLISTALQEAELAALESGWRACLLQLETIVGNDARDHPLSGSARLRLSRLLVDWEASDLQAQMLNQAPTAQTDTTIDQPRLEAYLRDRFNEPGLAVEACRVLPGGFGKQTYLFDVRGTGLNGCYVLRRDLIEPLMDNDCHRIHHEFALIRAVHTRGFPAPEALWCDTEHRLLPGGDFLVMRCAPGVSGGSVFASSGAVPADLSQTLAGILARLHGLPPLAELDTVIESCSSERGQLSIQDCTRRYVQDWLALYRSSDHMTSSAILSQFGWLLENIPASSGRPVLLHGDMGFHNFLFEERDGERHLSAVLDWEFGHVGDPAEDLAYVRNTLGETLDWPAFLAAYEAAGGSSISDERIRFFEVWGHVRNAAGSSLAAGQFAMGRIRELKMVLLPHLYIPMFLRAAQAAMERKTS